jgi:hypothetical protein
VQAIASVKGADVQGLSGVAVALRCNRADETMEDASEMDIQPTLLDLMNKLGECLRDLDQIGASVAAAHLSACIDTLGDWDLPDSNISVAD